MMKQTADDVFSRFAGKRVLFISTKNRDYIRNTQEIRALEETAAAVTVVASGRSGYAGRLLYVYGWLLSHSCGDYDEVFVGFAPQLILPFWRGKFRKSVITADFFISLYDTMTCDRKKFRPDSIPGRFLRRLDQKTLERTDRVIADTRAHARYFSETFGVPDEKLRVVYLEADPDIYYPRSIQKPESCRDQFLVLYFGSILPLQGVDVILKTIELLRDVPGIRFEIIGPVGDSAGQTGNADFIPWLAQEELAEHIAYADLCLAGHFNPVIGKAKRTIPGKASIYEAMEKRMVLGDNPANRELFSDDSSHLFVRMGDAKALADLILRVSCGETVSLAESGEKR
ncbi:MAG: glycosyltransferase [Lachnospiraceae bacterium]|nr:glycosyltransferase [Lachnospiraceae bacterium]